MAKTKPAQRRSYNNRSRIDKSLASQKLIIETLVELLVDRKGGDVTFEDISKRSKVSVRSIYRFFKDKESLHRAMEQYLSSYLQVSNQQMESMDVSGFGRNAFELFDKNENFVLAYLYSQFGQQARSLFRKKLNQAMIAKVLERKKVELNTENLRKLALIVSLVNAKIWQDIRQDFGYSGEEMGASVEWAIETLIAAL